MIGICDAPQSPACDFELSDSPDNDVFGGLGGCLAARGAEGAVEAPAQPADDQAQHATQQQVAPAGKRRVVVDGLDGNGGNERYVSQRQAGRQA